MPTPNSGYTSIPVVPLRRSWFKNKDGTPINDEEWERILKSLLATMRVGV